LGRSSILTINKSISRCEPSEIYGNTIRNCAIYDFMDCILSTFIKDTTRHRLRIRKDISININKILNKIILHNANQAISNGEHEIFLSYLSDNIQWNFLGDKILSGKEQISRYINETYRKPPKFSVVNLVAEGDFVTAVVQIKIINNADQWVEYDYCDIWRFTDGKMLELKAFVIKNTR